MSRWVIPPGQAELCCPHRHPGAPGLLFLASKAELDGLVGSGVGEAELAGRWGCSGAVGSAGVWGTEKDPEWGGV